MQTIISVLKEIIQQNIRKEQIFPKTSSFRGFLYIPINLSDTTNTQKNLTVDMQAYLFDKYRDNEITISSRNNSNKQESM